MVSGRGLLTDKRRKRLEEFVSPFQVRSKTKVTLPGDFDPGFKGGLRKKKEGQKLLREGVELLSAYQARLAAQDTWGVLVVLQAIDAAGKDGTIRHVMSGVNPQGVSVHSFKVPSAEELGHDYLWRYSRRLPARGEIGIFNRSHYEEVLAVRLHPEYLDRQGLPEATRKGEIWQQRYGEINDWERYLSDNGIRIVKIFLNLSEEEQRARLLRRIDLPDHNWKFSQADITERGLWSDYQEAMAETLTHTSTEWAPWHVIPAANGGDLVELSRHLGPSNPATPASVYAGEFEAAARAEERRKLVGSMYKETDDRPARRSRRPTAVPLPR